MSEEPGFFARRRMRKELEKVGIEIDRTIPIHQQYLNWQQREADARERTMRSVHHANALEAASRYAAGLGYPREYRRREDRGRHGPQR